MENLVQEASGYTVFVNASDSVKDLVIGGVPATSSTPRVISERVAVLKLTASDSAGGVFAWNPAASVIVTRCVLHVKTVASGACTLDIGVAANGTTLDDTLIDGVDVHSATGLFDNLTTADAGTNGLAHKLVGATQFLTGSKASGAAAALAGFVYIHYYPTF